VPQILTVGIDSLAAGFAAGDYDACSTECNRPINLDAASHPVLPKLLVSSE
jgi:hypothetical protein